MSEDYPGLVDDILDVWGDYDDFEQGGFEYVAFLLEQDASDIRDELGTDAPDEDECVEELADVCINAMRMMAERGRDPFEEVQDRLENHQAKGQENIIARYQEQYEHEQ